MTDRGLVLAATATVPRMLMAPGYISLAYLIDFGMIKLTCYQYVGKVWKRYHFASISSNLYLKLSVSFEFVTCKDLPLFLFDIIAIVSNGKFLLKRSSSHSRVLQQFCLLSGLPIAMVVLLLASSKVNLLNDNTY